MIALDPGRPKDKKEKRPDTLAKRLAAIRVVRLRPQASTHQTARIQRLLEQIEVCSAKDGTGSQVRQERLASRLSITERTLRRWLAIAVEEGLLEFHDTWTIRGRHRLIKIEWSRVIDGPRIQPRERQLFFELDDVQAGQNVRSHADKMSASNKEDLDPKGEFPSPLPPETSEPLPAPEPQPAATEAREPGPREEQWEEVHELLVARGVSSLGAGGALRLCRRRGVELWQLHAVLRFYDSQAPAWGPGALRNRIADLQPGRTPEANWQRDLESVLPFWPPAPLARVKQPRQSSQTSQGSVGSPGIDLAKAREQRRQDWQRSHREARASFGAYWDDLSRLERLELVERVAGAFFRQSLERRGRINSADWQPTDLGWLPKAAEACGVTLISEVPTCVAS